LENIIEQYATLDNLVLCVLGCLYCITTVGYYHGVIVASGVLENFPYPRIAKVLCLFWPLFIIVSLIQAYFEGGKKDV
jgi:hypothetical protein